MMMISCGNYVVVYTRLAGGGWTWKFVQQQQPIQFDWCLRLVAARDTDTSSFFFEERQLKALLSG